MEFFLTIVLYHASAPPDRYYVQHSSYADCESSRMATLAEPRGADVTSVVAVCSNGRRPEGATPAEEKVDKLIRDMLR